MDTPTATGQNPAAPPEGMFRELLWVHAHLRQDLQTVRRLADAARDGLSPETILAEIRDLQTNSPLWRLKFGCIRYCRFINLHHQLEDTALFPTIRSQDPSLGTALDRLQADHRAVHAITDRIAAIADRVPGDASGVSRFELVAALGELEEHLLGHLTFEEESLGPLLSSWDAWPME